MDALRVYKQVMTKLKPYFAEHEMRPSSVRNMVLEQMCRLVQPFSAEQLVKACKAEHISVGTVYNTLNMLIDAHILHSIQRERGKISTEYEFVGPNIRMQMMCSKCGRVAEIHDKAITRLIQDRTYTNFIPRNYTLTIYGECKLCRRKVSRKKEAEPVEETAAPAPEEKVTDKNESK